MRRCDEVGQDDPALPLSAIAGPTLTAIGMPHHRADDPDHHRAAIAGLPSPCGNTGLKPGVGRGCTGCQQVRGLKSTMG